MLITQSYFRTKSVPRHHILFLIATTLVSYLLIKLIFRDYLFFDTETRFNSVLAIVSFFCVMFGIIVAWGANYERLVHFLFFSFQPFWNRGGSYIDLLGLGEFYFITGQFAMLLVYCLFLLSRTHTLNVQTIHFAFLIFGFTCFLILKLIFVSGDSTSTSLQIYHILLVLPFFLIGNYFLTNASMDKFGFAAIKYLYVIVIIYLILEMILKAPAVIKNPVLLITLGLRIGAEHSQSGAIAPLSGGIHDLLYFAFMMSIWPIIADRMAERNILSIRMMKFSSWFSFALVLLVFSKTPIFIALYSMFSVRLVRLRLSSILVFSLMLFLFQSFLFSFLDRFVLFVEGLSALASSGLSAFSAIDSSSASRFENLMYGWPSFSEYPWWGSSEFRIYTSLPITFFYNFGVILGGIPIFLIVFYFFRLRYKDMRFFIAIGLYSLLTFGNLAGVPGWRIPDEANTLASYIQLYGWVPSFNFGNLLTTYFIVLVMVRSNG